MNKPFFDDQAYIAEQFHIVDDQITQTARLAFQKINSFKFFQCNEAFRMNRQHLRSLIKGTLLNYMRPDAVLSDLGFFYEEISN